MTVDRNCVHITGASGAGVTTAGKLLASQLGVDLFDTDDFYWEPTDPPYRLKRESSERVRLIEERLDCSKGSVLAGSLGEWGNALIPRFALVVFLFVPTPVRISRLKARERDRFGNRLDAGGPMYDQHREFIAWAAGYDTARGQSGRSLQGHREWLVRLPCPVLRIESELATDQIVARILSAMGHC